MFSGDNKRTFQLGIDAGHGGSDPGAVYDDVKEKDVNMQMARDLYNIIYYYGFNVKAHFTRLKNKTLTLRDRGEMLNDRNLDLVISLHCNAADNALAQSSLVFVYPGNQNSAFLGYRLLNNLPWKIAKDNKEPIETSSKDWSRRAHNVVCAFKAPTILFEMGFLRNQDDRDYLSSSIGRFNICHSIIKTVTDYAHEKEQSSHP